VITITHQIEERVRELWPVRPERVETIYYGLDLAHLDVPADRIAAAREQWQLAPAGRRIGLVGQICAIKGQLEVFRAFRAIAPDFDDVSLVFAGTPVYGEEAYYAQLQTEIAESGLAERVRLIGFCDQVPALLRNIDIFALGSHHEPFGRVVIEALAAGCITIGTNAGGVPEIIDDGRDGLLYEARDVAGLEAVLRRALQMSAEECAAMRAAAAEKVSTKFGMDRFMQELQRTYAAVLAEGEQ
jgi:glycosyltransferase involved in cell wall biosynthesis